MHNAVHIRFFEFENVLMPDFSRWELQLSRSLIGCAAWGIPVADSHHWADRFYKSKNVLVPDFPGWELQRSRFLMGCTTCIVSVADSHHWADLRIIHVIQVLHYLRYQFVQYCMYMVLRVREYFNARFPQLGASAAEIPHGLYHMVNLGC